jgi:hypothetical protein
MPKKELELGQNMSKKDLADARDEAVKGMASNEYEEFVTGRYEALDKLPWFRKCKDSVRCEAYKNSKIQKNSFRIFSSKPSIEEGKYTYYDKSKNTPPYLTRTGDPYALPEECHRCGAPIKSKLTSKNKHPHWGKVCNDCADVLNDSKY